MKANACLVIALAGLATAAPPSIGKVSGSQPNVPKISPDNAAAGATLKTMNAPPGSPSPQSGPPGLNHLTNKQGESSPGGSLTGSHGTAAAAAALDHEGPIGEHTKMPGRYPLVVGLSCNVRKVDTIEDMTRENCTVKQVFVLSNPGNSTPGTDIPLPTGADPAINKSPPSKTNGLIPPSDVSSTVGNATPAPAIASPAGDRSAPSALGKPKVPTKPKTPAEEKLEQERLARKQIKKEKDAKKTATQGSPKRTETAQVPSTLPTKP
ncbi:hypothetical protein CDD80_4800 [Ophiocordyceps camponoti-rufipedis]|uniref:Uncharacterized protein n=1 Tax=Ophiocordyceps camponoti-rufipedis TaxID=2004952 RepID=A0A2C5YYF1_9HYPO|nr:hypothetical protein CDD80_4800 [Ophiocordyceps camponoti-rufipedis]